MMDTTSTVTTPQLISDTMSSSSLSSPSLSSSASAAAAAAAASAAVATATATAVVALRGGAPKFPFRLYEMLDDAEEQGFDHIVSWIMVPSKNKSNKNNSKSNNSKERSDEEDTYFKVHDRTKFTEELLPKYFPKQTKYRSFLRQLNLYAFNHIKDRKCSTLFGCYYHPQLIRYRKENCYYITRGSQPTANASTMSTMSASATTGSFTKVPYGRSSSSSPTASSSSMWWKEDAAVGGLFDAVSPSTSPSRSSRNTKDTENSKFAQSSFPWDNVIDVASVDVYDENDIVVDDDDDDGGLTSEDEYDLVLEIADDCFAAASASSAACASAPSVHQQQHQHHSSPSSSSSSYDEKTSSYEPFEMDRRMTFMHRVASLSPSEIDTMISTINFITRRC